jgi:Fur family ferric uptake transcriptional regulator
MKIKHCGHKSHSHDSSKTRFEECVRLVKGAGLRLTDPRSEVLKALSKTEKPLSTDELFDLVVSKSVDKVTVYRNLLTLEDTGVLRRQDFGDGIRRYEIANASHHHHYVVCRGCGVAEPFDDCSFIESTKKHLEKKGFRDVQHTLGVTALCKACSAKAG